MLRENPPSRSANRRGLFGGAIRIVVFGASVSFGFGGLMLFWWFSVGLRKYDCSFVLEISLLNRSSISADCGALAFSPTSSLIYRKGAGHRDQGHTGKRKERREKKG